MALFVSSDLDVALFPPLYKRYVHHLSIIIELWRKDHIGNENLQLYVYIIFVQGV